MAKKKSKKMKINPKYLSGSKNTGRRAQLIRQIADIYKRGKPYPSNLNALMKERDKLMDGGPRKFQSAGNPYAMPTSAATSGYTSNMSGMAGAHQAAMQLQQLQQEIMQNQQMESAQAKQREADQKQQFQQDIQQQTGKLATEENAEQIQDALSKRASRRAAKKLAKQGVESAATANAGILAQANQAAPIMMDPSQVAGRTLTMGDDMLGVGQQVVGAPAANSLSLTGSQVAGKAASQAARRAAATNAAGPIGAGMSLVGTGVEHFSDDNDDTRTNFGEGSGRALKGAGTAVGLAGTLGTFAPALALGPLGLVAAGVIGGGAALLRQRKQKMEARKEEATQQAQDAQMASAEDAAFKQSMLTTGQDMGYNVGNAMSNSYLPGYQMKAGGYMKPLPGGAVEFVGPKHSQGGIMLDSQTEVEGGETMDKVKMRDSGGKAGDYIFSDYLKLGGKTFAARHKELLSGGAKQKQIQELAKLQEQVAKREGRDENGPRGPERIMRAGGVRRYQSGDEITGVIPSPDALDQYELDAESAYARDFPEGQSRTDEGLYRRADGDTVTMDEVEALKMNNPWYDFDAEGFDPTDPASVEKFQQAYNEKVPESKRIKVDGKVGEQTVSAYIPYKRKEAEVQEEPKVQEEPPAETPTEETAPEDTPEDTPIMGLPRERRGILLPYQLMGPTAELMTKYPQPNKVTAPVTGRIKLPRVNYNAERATLANSTNSANRFIQNQAAGPGAIASQMAMVEKQRQGNIDIATQEARQNKELASTESLANLRASQFDATNVARARQFNAIAQNQRDQNEYEKQMMAYNQLGTNLAQFSNDVRAYKSEERMAKAYQIDNEYDRQIAFDNAKRDSRRKKSPYHGMNDMEIRENIAIAFEQGAPTWNRQNQRRANAVIQAVGNQPNTEEQKRGGYVRKLGGVKRRKRRK
jgi:hypothetical protein